MVNKNNTGKTGSKIQYSHSWGNALPIYNEIKPQISVARSTFYNLDSEQTSALKRVANHSYICFLRTSYIDKRILTLIYELGLFIGSDYWPEGLKWLEQNTKERINQLDLDMTLLLLNSALARDDEFGADYWYRKRITGRLLKHLVELKTAQRRQRLFCNTLTNM